ncbi:hypothetical protein [Ruegeria arenilitoris]|uniref:hypothetical protein n=1 Tax=Ruegeria arenilitoris TaxID=1173585 RepID=UPI00147AC4EB|nr:hypothetical protein [Ruegeria arenilitoris]
MPENPRPYYRDHTLPEVSELVDALVSVLQLRVGSRLEADLDTLAISSFAMTLLSFRRGDSPMLPSWIHQYGPKLLLFLVASNVVLLLVIFVLGFIRKR